jgi:sialate O-acetylesterase
MRRVLLPLLVLTLALVQPVALLAATPHGIFTDHMVLQRDMPIPVWGTGLPGEKITVKFAGHSAQTVVGEDGNWKVELAALPAGGPHRMTIDGIYRVALRDLHVGEVWLASGQSNMQWPLKITDEPEKAIAESKNPKLRLFTVPRRSMDEPQTDVAGRWEICGPESTPEFSAVAYYFGRALQQKLNVPVGMISTNVGGTPAEAWMCKEALAANDVLKHYVERGRDPNNMQRPYGLYNAMVHPLGPMNVRGAIWYQGESNAGAAYEYRTLFPAMIADWRRTFRQPEMPFLFVQLAPFMDKVAEPRDSAWAELRDAQLLTAKNDPHTAMAVITDVGDEKDIHPKWKKPVGERLALAARAIAYGEQIPFTGPLFASSTVDNGTIVLEFEKAGGALQAKDGPLTGFAIAGEDGKFVNATAEIIADNKVRVQSSEVSAPKYVRYDWADFPVGNLWDSAGLPATPFRTDELPLTTQPK